MSGGALSPAVRTPLALLGLTSLWSCGVYPPSRVRVDCGVITLLPLAVLPLVPLSFVPLALALALHELEERLRHLTLVHLEPLEGLVAGGVNDVATFVAQTKNQIKTLYVCLVHEVHLEVRSGARSW